MSEHTGKPEIRFAGFTETWEQRKLGEVSVITSGYMGNSMLSNGKYHLTRIETISDGKVDNERVGYSNEKPDDMYLLHKGDILYSNINSISHMGKVAEYEGNAELYHGINLLRLVPDLCMDSDFLLYLLNTNSCRNWAKTRANQAVSQASINQSLLATQEIAICSLNEQQQIGTFFRQLDNLITLHQRKRERLENIKKAMLEKMFPKNGADVPEIRFAGFTEAWEQRKAKDLFVSTADKGHPELPVLSATQDRGMIRRDENSINVFHDKKNEIGYKRVLPGQFVIHLRSFQGGFAHSSIEGITSPAYTVFGFSEPDNQDSEYWKYVFTSKEFIRRLETVTYGIRDGRSISYDEFLTLDFTYPCKKEQTEIARYLDTLSNLITLHQRKVALLQNIKKACLEKMFA